MNYGLYMAASGMLANLHRMDVLSNNLANVETAGFKPMVASLRQRDAARIEDGLTSLPSNAMLERLGAGVMVMPHRMLLQQGAPERTSRPLDVAINGPGFLVVQQGTGDAGPGSIRLTRDGRMTLDKKGRLVHQATGLPMLDETNRPITVTGDEPLAITAQGDLKQGQRTIARLQVTSISDTSRLRPTGDGLLTAPAAVLAKRTRADSSVTSGSYEKSAVDSVKTMTEMMDADRAVTSNLKLIQLQDQLMDRAINTFGRIA